MFLANQQRPSSMQNSCSSVGNRTKEGKDSTKDQQLETDCGDVNDESTPCGCSHAQYTIGKVRTSLIPEQNLRRLKENFEHKTIAMIIAKHLKNFFRRRIIEKSISY